MKKIILNYEKSHEFGYCGLIVDGLNDDTIHPANEGVLVAHDLIEHSDLQSIGGAFNEVRAMGAMWYVRGEYCDISRQRVQYYSSVEILAHELFTCFESYVYRNECNEKPEPIRTHCCDYDEEFNEAITLLKKDIRDYSLDAEQSKDSQVFLDWVLPYLRRGYRQCKRRFWVLSQMQLNTLFWSIAQAIDEVLPQMEYEGQQVLLTYSLVSLDAKACVFEEEYE